MLPYPNRLRALLQPLRAYANTPLQQLARRSGLTRLFGPEIEAMEQLLPPLVPESFTDRLPRINPANAERRGRVALLLGCVQRCFDPSGRRNGEGAAGQRFRSGDSAGPGLLRGGEPSPGRAGAHPPTGDEPRPSMNASRELDAVLVAPGCTTMKAYDELLNGNLHLGPGAGCAGIPGGPRRWRHSAPNCNL